MQLSTRNIRAEFTADDLELLSSIAAQVSLAIENAALHEELLTQRDMQRDLEFATQIQLGFLPSERPKVDGYEFYDYYEAAMRVGGDYFDYIVLPDGRVAIALGDVAGKGVPAALLMARLFSSARFHLLTQPHLGKAIAGLNEEIASSGLGHRFITFVATIIDPQTHSITIVNAGHLPPILRLANGDVTPVGQNESGMPLGVSPKQTFHETKLQLDAGSSLLLYTDGITEAMNAKNEIYGRVRLEGYLNTASDGTKDQVKGLVADVEEFCDGQPQRDDICLVCLKRSD
jgi:serine phosphatase RsbU (regulator of sigma subunit)